MSEEVSRLKERIRLQDELIYVLQVDIRVHDEMYPKVVEENERLREVLMYAKAFGSQGTIEGGEHDGMSVSYFIDEACKREEPETVAINFCPFGCTSKHCHWGKR